jgi:quinol-cytochrome oxidoreductase complex cytochrome b subunit
VRLHSEVGNLLFLFLYGHVLTKLWTSIDAADADGYATWVSGSTIFALTYVAGVTGAIMP